MIWLRRALGGLGGLFRRARADEDLDDELRDFAERAAEDGRRAGLGVDEAARSARLQLGSAAAVKDFVHDAGWESAFDSVWQDTRYAARSLRKSPGFTATAALTLALGIGGTTAIFGLLDALLLTSLPVPNPEQLVVVRAGGLYPVFQAFRSRTDIFVDLTATSGITPLDVEIGNGVRERTNLSLVSGSYFSTLGLRASIGRLFTADEDRVPGDSPIAIASDGYWQRRFARDPAILNHVVRINGTAITIVGVAPAGFSGEEVGAAPDLWIPLSMWGQVVPGRNLLQSPGTGWLRMVGRLRPGVATSGRQPELTRVFQDVVTGIFGPQASEDVRRDIANATVAFESAGRGFSALRAQFARPLQLLMGAVVIVLLIACANVANLLLARSAARRHEIDLRLALGVSRGRLIRQLLTESVLLASVGGFGGLALSWMGREALLRLLSTDGSRLHLATAIDARLVAFVVTVSFSTAILFGLAPAWHSTRAIATASLTMRHESGGRSGGRLKAILVIGQIAVSLVLLTGAGLFVKTILNLRDVDLGFSPERLLVLDVNPQTGGYRGERAMALTRRLRDRIAAVPGVSSVSFAENGLLTARDSGSNLIHPEGAVGGPEGFAHTHWDVVGPEYFSTIGASLVAGRDFTDRDDERAPRAVAINQQFARRFFPGTNPVGRRLVWGSGSGAQPLEIVAVVRDVKQGGAREGAELRFYLPYLQLPVVRPNWILASTRYLVRTSGEPAAVSPLLRQLVASEDPLLSVESLDSGPDLVGRTLVRERAVAVLLVTFGAFAVGLACLGLYGLIAYHVVQRTTEIGIRMALGSQRSAVLWAMLRPAAAWVTTGVAAGLPLAVAAGRFARSLLFGLSATDPRVLTGATIAMMLMGLVAAYLPARRASRVDPIVALRM
jgi:predicted permease